MTIDSKFYHGFSFIIKLLESFIVVYYTHQVYKPIAKVHQPVYKKPTNLGSNRFSLFQLFQLKLFDFGFTINSVFRRGREYIIVVLFELIEKNRRAAVLWKEMFCIWDTFIGYKYQPALMFSAFWGLFQLHYISSLHVIVRQMQISNQRMFWECTDCIRGMLWSFMG